MKIAVCFSGQFRQNAINNVELYRKVFQSEADFFFQTWHDSNEDFEFNNKFRLFEQDCLLPNERLLKTEEPIVDYIGLDQYQETSPWKFSRTEQQWTSNGGWRSMTWNRTKQMLAHAMLLNDIPKEYDMIIRARYDAKISLKNTNFWKEHLKRAYDNNISYGIEYEMHTAINEKRFGLSYPDWTRPHVFDVKPYDQYVFEKKHHHPDHMMFHKRSLFDIDYVYKQHNNKTLMPAELGWWDVLCRNGGASMQRIVGGVILEKNQKIVENFRSQNK